MQRERTTDFYPNHGNDMIPDLYRKCILKKRNFDLHQGRIITVVSYIYVLYYFL